MPKPGVCNSRKSMKHKLMTSTIASLMFVAGAAVAADPTPVSVVAVLFISKVNWLMQPVPSALNPPIKR